MSQSKDQARRNARQHIAAGGALLAASTGADVAANAAFRRSGASGYWQAVKTKKITGAHVKHAGAKVAINATRLAALPLIGYGLRNEVKPDKYVRRFDAKRDVVEAQINRWTAKEPASKRDAETWTQADAKNLQRRKKLGRKLSEASGTMGLAALALRVPQGAKAAARRSAAASAHPRVKRLVEWEPQATAMSNNLGVLAIGTGSAGSFNYAAQQKLEAKQARQMKLSKAAVQPELFDSGDLPRRNVGGHAIVEYPTGRRFKAPITGVDDGTSTEVYDPRAKARVRINNKLIRIRLRKADDTFLRRYRSRISPEAEQGYQYLRSGRNQARGQAAIGALNVGAGGVLAVNGVRSGGRLGAAEAAVGGLMAAGGGVVAVQQGRKASRWNGHMDKIKAKAYERSASGEFGRGRVVTAKAYVGGGRYRSIASLSPQARKVVRRNLAASRASRRDGTGTSGFGASPQQRNVDQMRETVAGRSPMSMSGITIGDDQMKHLESVRRAATTPSATVRGLSFAEGTPQHVQDTTHRVLAGRKRLKVPTTVGAVSPGKSTPIGGGASDGLGGRSRAVSMNLDAPRGVDPRSVRHELEHAQAGGRKGRLTTLGLRKRPNRSIQNEEARADAAANLMSGRRSTQYTGHFGADSPYSRRFKELTGKAPRLAGRGEMFSQAKKMGYEMPPKGDSVANMRANAPMLRQGMRAQAARAGGRQARTVASAGASSQAQNRRDFFGKGLIPVPKINYTRRIGAGLRTPRPRAGGLRRTPVGGTSTFRGSLPGTIR